MIEEINDGLRSETKDYITFGVPPNKLMDQMISAFAEGRKVEVGEMTISEDDRITIPRVKISQAGGSVTISNIIISNNPYYPGRISAAYSKIDRSILAKARVSERNIFQKFSTINDIFLAELKKRIDPDNDSWAPKRLSISGGMIAVELEKSD